MSEIRGVKLEILRHGPAHNQLLSPLTKYLVLCGNHSPETLELPWEHQELMSHLRILRYQDSDKTLEIERRTLGRRLAAVLGSIKSLISELSPHSQACGQLGVTDLRLVLSSEELALIPFELALTPEGCPGSGESLVLQNQAPLTITRQARRVDNRCFTWPNKTRILFAAAAPKGPIPVEAHLLALRQALAPWIPQWEDENESRKRFADTVCFLPNATWRSIARSCRENQFSHVHILAHGQRAGDGDDGDRFGLALHRENAPGEIDWVDGQRLADALRCFRDGGEGRQSCPAVVTLATCDGGNAGPVASVLGAGSSIAHALHESGVPLVVASQFPLSFRGSAIFAESVYEDLLRGKDPRLLMADLRRRLHGDVPTRHDWASLVCYCALPPDFETQLAEHRMLEANRSARVALNWADRMIESDEDRVDCKDELEKARKMANRALQWLNDCCQDPLIRPTKGRRELGGLLASAEKRLAEIHQKADGSFGDEALEALCRSRGHYRRLFEEDPPRAWGIVQYLVLEVFLRRHYRLRPATERNYKKRTDPGLSLKALRELWQTAYWMSRHERRYREDQPRAWALASLIEIQLLDLLLLDEEQAAALETKAAAPLEEGTAAPEERGAGREKKPVDSRVVERKARSAAKKYAAELARGVLGWHMDVYSTRRQIHRYCKFFPLSVAEASQYKDGKNPLLRLVDDLLEILPIVQPELD